MRRRVLISVCALLLTLATASAEAASATTRVPQGFAGVAIDSVLWPPEADVNLEHQLDLMVTNGVENLRPEFDWSGIQPYRSWADVPTDQRSSFTDVDGMPLDLTALDRLVGDCADRGLGLTPVVMDAPSWDAVPAKAAVYAYVPQDDAPYGRFLTALIHRYGPHGSFWSGRTHRLAVRTWGVWNEPNLPFFWSVQPHYAQRYIALLKVAYRAIKHADRGAKVVLAGLANNSWGALRYLLRVRGAARLFDVAAIHPYTRTPAGVMRIIKLFRQSLDGGGGRGKPIVVDEFGWNSSQGQTPGGFGPETTEMGQARDIAQVIRTLAAQRTELHIAGFDVYDWANVELNGAYEFQFAGLLKIVNHLFIAKPALQAYRNGALGLERCREKATDARRCARRA
jgi:hypothetical protein